MPQFEDKAESQEWERQKLSQATLPRLLCKCMRMDCPNPHAADFESDDDGETLGGSGA